MYIMVRYKRYRRSRYGRSTGVIKMKFQSFMDISTSDSSMQIITISAGGPEVLRRLAPQFSAYKYFKIGNIAVKLVPASTLPVDPTGLSITAGDNLVDPRDQLTPGMMRITNGEDIFENISGLSDAEQHAIYNNMLLDPRWFKWMLQSGVKRHATPRYWQIGQLHQDKFPGAFQNVPQVTDGSITGTATVNNAVVTGTGHLHVPQDNNSSQYGFFQTGHRGVLGWLPTDSYQHYLQSGTGFGDQALIASPVEVEVMKLILPKAYKTRYWYRMFITETVYFREPIVNFGVPSGVTVGGQDVSYRPLDVFHYPTTPGAVPPTTGVTYNPSDSQTGGNYGND